MCNPGSVQLLDQFKNIKTLNLTLTRVEQYTYTTQYNTKTIRIKTQYTKCLEGNTCIIVPPPPEPGSQVSGEAGTSVVRRELYRVRSMAEPAVATAVRQPEAIQKGMNCTRVLEC